MPKTIYCDDISFVPGVKCRFKIQNSTRKI